MRQLGGVPAVPALLALLAWLEVAALRGSEGEVRPGAPCPPCHCSREGSAVDAILDCSQVVLPIEGPLAVPNWNATGFGTVLLDSSLPQGLPVLPALPGVRKLSLRDNNLVTLESGAFLPLPDLIDLDLSRNKLTADAVRADVLRGPWRASSYESLMLETLDLSFNDLHSLLRRSLEHLPRLRRLHLDGNPLNVLDHNIQAALASVTSLQVLSLSGCGLSSLPEDFNAVLSGGKLVAMDLSANALSAVPRSLPSSLERLDLDANPIRRLPARDTLEPAFLRLDRLEQLSLSYMPQLEEIADGAFYGLPRLRTLSCTDNPVLRSIAPGAFSHLGPSWVLVEVSLRNNSLTSLSPGVLAWRGLSYLDVSHNPWHCSCKFSRWATSTLLPVNLNSRESYRCGSPAELAGESLWNVTAVCAASTASSSPDGRLQQARSSLLSHILLMAVSVLLLACIALLVRHYCLGRRRAAIGSRTESKQRLFVVDVVDVDPQEEPLVA